LIGGTTNAESMGIPGEVQSAIARIGPADDLVVTLCTATAIGEHTLLTARHCLETEAGTRLVVDFSDEVGAQSCGASTRELVDVELHPTFDVALLTVARPNPSSAPLAAFSGLVRAPVVMSGFGIRRDGLTGVREFLGGMVTEFDELTLRTRADAGRGTCSGDSGGPLFEFVAEGPRYIGVLSTGSVTCEGNNNYVRTDALREWLAERTGD
jgi:hypothetical protein